MPEVSLRASPPEKGMVYRSPTSSKTMALPSAETSSESQVPSVVMKSTLRAGLSGRGWSFFASFASSAAGVMAGTARIPARPKTVTASIDFITFLLSRDATLALPDNGCQRRSCRALSAGVPVRIGFDFAAGPPTRYWLDVRGEKRQAEKKEARQEPGGAGIKASATLSIWNPANPPRSLHPEGTLKFN